MARLLASINYTRDVAGSHANAKKRRLLSAEVQNSVEARALVEYHIAIAAGRCNVRLNPNGQGIMWDEKGGIQPTQAERTASVNWLSDRGHGLPVQAHVLHAQFSGALEDAAPSAGALPAPMVWMIRDALQSYASRAIAAPAPDLGLPEPANVIDVDMPPASSSSNPPTD